MDDSLKFDVSVTITDPTWSIGHEAYYRGVSVVFSEPEESPRGLLRLFFKTPDTVLTLGQQLTTAGMRLAAQLRTSLPDSADSDQVSGPEEYPVPGRKSSGVESGDER